MTEMKKGATTSKPWSSGPTKFDFAKAIAPWQPRRDDMKYSERGPKHDVFKRKV